MKDEGIFGGIGGAILLVFIASFFINNDRQSITVYYAHCKHPTVNDICDDVLGMGGKDKYVVHIDIQEVVSQSAGGTSFPTRFTDCAVQNARNWSCKYVGEQFGFSGGKYFERLSLQATWDKLGIYRISWWQWWLMQFGAMEAGNNSDKPSASELRAATLPIGDLPTVVGQCSGTTVTEVGTRLIDGNTNSPISGSGSAISYANGGSQVSYDTIRGIEVSQVGDRINLCLIAIPTDCPLGDDRGRVYTATNMRTNVVWTAADSSHSCGGA